MRGLPFLPDHWYITFIPVLGKYTNIYLLCIIYIYIYIYIYICVCQTMYICIYVYIYIYIYMYYTQRSNPWYTCICAYVTGWFVGVYVFVSIPAARQFGAIENPSNQPWLGVTIKNISPHPELRGEYPRLVGGFNPSGKYESQLGWL